MATDTHGGDLRVATSPDESIWLRGLYMLFFGLVCAAVEAILLAVILVQFGWNVLAGESNTRLAGFGATLGVYCRDIIRYWTFASEEKPFPFADWPSLEPTADES